MARRPRNGKPGKITDGKRLLSSTQEQHMVKCPTCHAVRFEWFPYGWTGGDVMPRIRCDECSYRLFRADGDGFETEFQFCY